MSSQLPQIAASQNMNLSSANLERLTAEFPSDADAVLRLAEFLARYAGRQDSEFTARKIFDVAHPSSQRILALILQRLIQQGVLEEIVRVESDAGGGIGDYPSLNDVPAEVEDWRSGLTVPVRPENLRLIYKMRA